MEEIAQRLGAKIVSQVPDVGGGALAAAHLAKLYQSRMEELRKKATVSMSEENFVGHLNVLVKKTTLDLLKKIAEKESTPDRKLDHQAIASELLEKAVLHKVEEIA